MFDALRAAPGPDRPDTRRTRPGGLSRGPAGCGPSGRVLTELSADAFGYPDPQGALTFRRSIAGWLARNRGMTVAPEQVVVVAGVAQALALLARVLRADGIDRIAVEDPGSRGARLQLQSWGITHPADSGGRRRNSGRRPAGRAARRPCCSPRRTSSPPGWCSTADRRRELQSWAADGGLIIEDDYDAEHRYDRPPTPALHSMLADQVCYAGSVSKLLAPALRVGWLVVPDRYRRGHRGRETRDGPRQCGADSARAGQDVRLRRHGATPAARSAPTPPASRRDGRRDRRTSPDGPDPRRRSRVCT